MFDWARGSMLKKLVELRLFPAAWEYQHFILLKNWHVPWFLGLVELNKDLRILDVGSASPGVMALVHRKYGCEVHALDAADASAANFGFDSEAGRRWPEVTMHVGFAGDDLLPAEMFDVVSCISTLEHTYDQRSPVEAQRPMQHLHALRDMVRMLKPGGVLLMNWDFFLDLMPQHVGWDFEVDYQVLKSAGLRLFSDRRRVQNTQYLYDHPDTLFFDQGHVLQFKHAKPVRGTAINMLWQKPGDESRLRLNPRPELAPLYFPDVETQSVSSPTGRPDVSTEQIETRFREIIAHIGEVLGRSDIDGKIEVR
jgi:SAM-dependent methyltransferase